VIPEHLGYLLYMQGPPWVLDTIPGYSDKKERPKAGGHLLVFLKWAHRVVTQGFPDSLFFLE
jgi:hypothetical protein